MLLYLGVFVLAVAAGTRGNARRWRDGMAIGPRRLSRCSRSRAACSGISSVIRTWRRCCRASRSGSAIRSTTGTASRSSSGSAFPLLLGCAADTPATRRALAVAPLPALVAVIYLASSRGGAATAIVGTARLLALTPRRLAALAATACAAAGAAAGGRDLQGASGAGGRAARFRSRRFPGRERGPPDRPDLRWPPALSTGSDRGSFRAVSFRPGRCNAGWAGGRRRASQSSAAVVAVDPAERFDRFKQAPGAPSGGQAGFTESHLLSGGGSGRWQFWSAAVDEFESRPVVGRGAGSFEAWWAQHGTISYFIRDAHSLYVETLGELGLVGLALLAAVFRQRPRRSRGAAVERERRSSAAAVLSPRRLPRPSPRFAVGAAIDWAWELTVVGVVVGGVCLGLICGPATAAQADRGKAHASRPHRRRGRRRSSCRLRGGGTCGRGRTGDPDARSERDPREPAGRSARRRRRTRCEARCAAREPAGLGSLAPPSDRTRRGAGRRPRCRPRRHRRTRSSVTAPTGGTWLVSARLEAKAGRPAERARAARPGAAAEPEVSAA